MSKWVSQSAVLTCNQSLTPCPLNVVTNQTVQIEGKLAATINDITPANMPTFGTCNILTSAAQGVPQPCVPKIIGPWLPGVPKVSIQGQVALADNSKAICACGGQVSISFAGQTSTMSS